MEVLEKIEKVLNVKIENVEEVRGRSFPLFDLLSMRGIKLALIKNPLFLVIEGDDVYEKRVEGNFIVVETDRGYLLARYTGEPNIEALRDTDSQNTEETDKEVEPEEKEVETQNEEDEKTNEEGGEDGQDGEQKFGGDPVKEILEKLPKWADGAVITKKGGDMVALPIKRSTKKENAYYASVSWRPLEVSGIEELMNHVITKDGKVVKSNVYVGDKYINIFTGSRPSNRPRRGGYYPGRRR
jgi:hypothetical protein